MGTLSKHAEATQLHESIAKAPLARLLAILLSFALMSWIVVSGSAAVFNDTTDNTGNSFTAGDVDLIDNDLGFMMFDVEDMEPGESVSSCILVTYQGTIPDPSRVAIYSGGYTDSGDFADYLNITIEEGTGGTLTDCTLFVSADVIEENGTLAEFDTNHFDYGSGAGVWDPSGTPEAKSYKITVELDSDAPNSEQGESVTGLTFTWEIQS